MSKIGKIPLLGTDSYLAYEGDGEWSLRSNVEIIRILLDDYENNLINSAGVALAKMMSAKQARIDELMLEFCPDEMTEEQMQEYEKHQRIASEEYAALNIVI